MSHLGVNIDHVATLRQARGTTYPSVLDAARESIAGGADQITIHLREDRRHIQDKDVVDLKKEISVPLNLEMAAEEEIINIAIEIKPHLATLVPEKRQELTTEGGLDLVANKAKIANAVSRLKAGGIQVNLFIDPESDQVNAASELGADSIELHTGKFCEAKDEATEKIELVKLKESSAQAKKLGLRVCAGHGLNYENTREVFENIPEIVEYNIGHAIIARAVFVGLKKAVSEMRNLVS